MRIHVLDVEQSDDPKHGIQRMQKVEFIFKPLIYKKR